MVLITALLRRTRSRRDRAHEPSRRRRHGPTHRPPHIHDALAPRTTSPVSMGWWLRRCTDCIQCSRDFNLQLLSGVAGPLFAGVKSTAALQAHATAAATAFSIHFLRRLLEVLFINDYTGTFVRDSRLELLYYTAWGLLGRRGRQPGIARAMGRAGAPAPLSRPHTLRHRPDWQCMVPLRAAPPPLRRESAGRITLHHPVARPLRPHLLPALQLRAAHVGRVRLALGCRRAVDDAARHVDHRDGAVCEGPPSKVREALQRGPARERRRAFAGRWCRSCGR